MSSQPGFTDTLSPGTTSTNTSRRSTSTVRSRTRRLVSFGDGDEENNGKQLQSSGLSAVFSPDASGVRSRGATPSPNPSRGISPIPKSHPSRATESSNWGSLNSSLGGMYSGKGQANFADSSRAAVDFFDSSWSSLQSLASSVLGSDIARPATNDTPRTHVRKPSRPDPYMRNPSRTVSNPSSWGPSAPSTPEIGCGTKEERLALVQAKKREALLLADTSQNGGGSSALHKRRDSSDRTDHSAIDPEQDEEALAYIHHVKPTDTITGVTIRYGCQPAVFRKANGFWPSDSIQGRKTVLLPVDSCTVKGRPIPQEGDLLGNNKEGRDSLEDLNGSSIAPISPPESATTKGEAFPDAEVEGDRIWKPESRVQIDGFPEAVEIGRVPRRALGFFPRTRRKSMSYTDSEPHSLSERERTATMSSSSSPVESQSSRSTASLTNRPHADSSGSRVSNSKRGGGHRRQRSNLQLAGPGVGTLDRNAMAPGPALDGLSKFFAQHMPNLAPAPAPPNFQGSSEYNTASSNTPTGLDNLGGAVEGWVRKMTTRAKASFNDLQPQSPPRGQRTGRRGMGDLIELNDGLESRNSSGLLGETHLRPEYSRTGSSLHDGSLRGRFPSPSGTSGTRSLADRAKDE